MPYLHLEIRLVGTRLGQGDQEDQEGGDVSFLGNGEVTELGWSWENVGGWLSRVWG